MKLDELLKALRELGFVILGYASDGDPSYYKIYIAPQY
jgi:hypothetical protein